MGSARGCMGGAPSGRCSGGEGRRRGRHRRGGIRRCGAPAHANPDPAHGRHELRGYWRVLRAQPRRPRASGQVRRHGRQGNGEGARVAVAAQSSKRPQHTRGTAYASGWPQEHGATSTKTKSRACPTWTPAPSTHARFATCRRLTRGGESREQRKTEHRRAPLGRREWAAQQGGHRPVGGVPPPPQTRLRESGGGAPT
jgi:hypothetical protein